MEKIFITVRNATVIKRIDTLEILYVMVDGDCLTFRLQNGEQFSCSKTLNGITVLLPSFFIRIHRSCLVNTLKISEFKLKKRRIVLLNGNELEVSFRNIKVLTDALTV